MKKLLFGLATCALLASVSQAQVVFNTDTDSYSQNFNTLESGDSTSATFTDNSTIAGWYVNSEEMDSNSDEYFGEDGSSTGGEVYSFGDPDDSDRALGYVGSGGNDYFNVALQLDNNSGVTINTITVQYTGEQWRSGGNTSDNNNFLNFAYQIFPGAGSIPADTSLTGWTEVNALDFTPPQINVAAGALDGNLNANRTTFDVDITGLGWDDGEELWIRWIGDDGSGSDAGIGIDDVTVTAIPEPSSFMLMGLGAAALYFLRRRQ